MARKRAAFRYVIWLGLAIILIVGIAWYAWPHLYASQHAQSGQPAAAGTADTAQQHGDQAAAGGRRNRRQLGAGVVPVMAVTARSGDISVSLNALGTVTPLATVTVRPQLSGYLTEVAFTEGQMVKQGDFLAQIDPRPYQIALEQAQGQLARDQALLKNAYIDLARYQKLTAQDSIARQQLDTQQSLVAQYQGTIVSDQAQVDTAKLDLVYCHITSPVTGRVGLRQVDQGNYVQTGDANGLVVVTQIQPITVIFTIPEDNIPLVQKELQAGNTLSVTSYDRSGANKLATGTLSTIDNQIDTSTGSVKLRAQFDNTDYALFPNQFVNVNLLVHTEHAQAIVPMAAIQHGATDTYVYLVKAGKPAGTETTEKAATADTAGKTASADATGKSDAGKSDAGKSGNAEAGGKAARTVVVQPIKIGITSGDDVEILSGLNAGDQVVVDGVDQLRDGSKVVVTDANKAKPADETIPTDSAPGSKAAKPADAGTAN